MKKGEKKRGEKKQREKNKDEPEKNERLIGKQAPQRKNDKTYRVIKKNISFTCHTLPK